MKVRQISERKSINDVASTTADAKLADVATKLGTLKIGCLIVLDDKGEVSGILSERDIVRAVGEKGADCLDQRVDSIMTREVMTCTPEDSAASILERMSGGRFRHMPVMEDGKVISVVSIGDIVKAKIEELEQDNEAMESMIRSGTA